MAERKPRAPLQGRRSLRDREGRVEAAVDHRVAESVAGVVGIIFDWMLRGPLLPLNLVQIQKENLEQHLGRLYQVCTCHQ